MSVELEKVMTDEPDSIAGALLEVVIDPIDEVVIRVHGLVVFDDLVALVQLAVLLVDPVDLGRSLADLVVGVDEAFEDGVTFVFRNCGDVDDLRPVVHVGGGDLEVDVVNVAIVRL
jgi:hypothetical protein